MIMLCFFSLSFYRLHTLWIIHGFCICKFTYLLKFVTPEINTLGAFAIICVHTHKQTDENSNDLTTVFPGEVNRLRSLF